MPAVEYLKQAFNEGLGFRGTDLPYIGYYYDFDPELIPLHGYPAYEDFVKPKG